MRADLIEAVRAEVLVGADSNIDARETAATILDVVLSMIRDPSEEVALAMLGAAYETEADVVRSNELRESDIELIFPAMVDIAFK